MASSQGPFLHFLPFSFFIHPVWPPISCHSKQLSFNIAHIEQYINLLMSSNTESKQLVVVNKTSRISASRLFATRLTCYLQGIIICCLPLNQHLFSSYNIKNPNMPHVCFCLSFSIICSLHLHYYPSSNYSVPPPAAFPSFFSCFYLLLRLKSRAGGMQV